MKKEKLEVVRGSGNVFRDLGHKNADAEQFKAILAAEIIKAIDRERLTVRAAHKRTGIAAADFSRIRNADLGRFTVDRLMAIINRLGSRVEVPADGNRRSCLTRSQATKNCCPANGTKPIGDPTIADGILERLLHNAHRIEMRGESMRKKCNPPPDESRG
jgi:predicted XRE-type DNA-binding protein